MVAPSVVSDIPSKYFLHACFCNIKELFKTFQVLPASIVNNSFIDLDAEKT